ncbi:hypothetical protein FACUT_13958 [Fusarium acutatum]|uniref:Uncharacterized protein n=1 Tax=Fusarium acutatum TaxID=78861 RepID=A0A8H4J847_9HYPO|nr:hypothetical protein FACUT_13958 [Fusarium acutatum]
MRLTWLPASVGTGDNPQRPKRTASPEKNISPPSMRPDAATSVSYLNEPDRWLDATIDDATIVDDAQLRQLLTHAVDNPQLSRGFLLLDHEAYLLSHFNRCVHGQLMHLMGDWLTDLLYHPYLQPALIAISASNLFQEQWYSHAFDFNYSEELSSEAGCVLTIKELMNGLDATKQTLQEWHNGLDGSRLPVLQASLRSALDQNFEDQLVLVEDVAPLHFQTPEAAFDYLRYAVSLVITSPQVLGIYVLANRPKASKTHVPAVVAHLLSVIEGLDPAQLIRYDVYDSGPLWVLVTLALRSYKMVYYHYYAPQAL